MHQRSGKLPACGRPIVSHVLRARYSQFLSASPHTPTKKRNEDEETGLKNI